MKKIIYWSNKTKYHEQILGEIIGSHKMLLTESDQKFELMTGLNPIKNPWISCQIVPLDEE